MELTKERIRLLKFLQQLKKQWNALIKLHFLKGKLK
jgi:hypothetical protein